MTGGNVKESSVMERKRMTFRCDQKIWDEAGEVLEGTGITRGKFLEMTLRGLAQSKKLSMKDVMGNIVGDLFDVSLVRNVEVVKKPKKKK
jgi:antitoxin component of RelBE/YafQ-DinJ toxin-antitoxin module